MGVYFGGVQWGCPLYLTVGDNGLNDTSNFSDPKHRIFNLGTYRKNWNTSPGVLTTPFGLLPHAQIEENGVHPHRGINNILVRDINDSYVQNEKISYKTSVEFYRLFGHT